MSFSTTDDGLKAVFRSCPGFRSAVVMRKKARSRRAQDERYVYIYNNNIYIYIYIYRHTFTIFCEAAIRLVLVSVSCALLSLSPVCNELPNFCALGQAAVKKGAKAAQEEKGLSMGYGFLEFETTAQAWPSGHLKVFTSSTSL